MALLGMLLVTFTLLPYQTSMLVTAMGYSSGYQRASYSAAAHGRHVLLVGQLYAPRLRTLLEQLFHADYGGCLHRPFTISVCLCSAHNYILLGL